MKSIALLSVLFSLFAVVAVSGCIQPPTTTTVKECLQYGTLCSSSYDCCEGLYCTAPEKRCFPRSCGDNICQYDLETIDDCPQDCAPKTLLSSFVCVQSGSTLSVSYKSRNINNASFYEWPTYELLTNLNLTRQCDPNKETNTGCLSYKSGAVDYYNINVNQTHDGEITNISLIQPNPRFIYYNTTPPQFWLRLCLSSFSIESNAPHKGSASCTFIANTECTRT